METAITFGFELTDELVVECGAVVGCDKAVKAFPLDRVRLWNNSGLRNQGMLHQHGLYLRRAHQMARYVEHIIHAPCHPQVTIRITPRAWAWKQI